MNKLYVCSIALPIAVLCGCGTPLVWRGPAGTSEQEQTDAKRECLTRAEAWRRLNMQAYDQSGVYQYEVNTRASVTGQLYASADQLFGQCMREQGYALVPRE
jgi:hypothetical protein